MTACPLPWCTTPHTHGRGHTAHAGEVAGITFLYMQGEIDGTLAEPIVRLLYPVDQRTVALDLSPQFAHDLRNLLDAIPAGQVNAFAAALLHASHTLGGTHA